ncbi:hypothetical protein SLEP1_g34103 [Rubroshorea leprosula]|uniref:Uncharacterized protein n=1 Tax=Rubroshorea leprosula TaxID=152421 RepID=A0AAV5KJ10_9ROSI|nr:hypothetical protein SLEP1_g34103 [Rubroshorea leprosula]
MNFQQHVSNKMHVADTNWGSCTNKIKGWEGRTAEPKKKEALDSSPIQNPLSPFSPIISFHPFQLPSLVTILITGSSSSICSPSPNNSCKLSPPSHSSRIAPGSLLTSVNCQLPWSPVIFATQASIFDKVAFQPDSFSF